MKIEGQTPDGPAFLVLPQGLSRLHELTLGFVINGVSHLFKREARKRPVPIIVQYSEIIGFMEIPHDNRKERAVANPDRLQRKFIADSRAFLRNLPGIVLSLFLHELLKRQDQRIRMVPPGHLCHAALLILQKPE